jgi:hypothetical protein
VAGALAVVLALAALAGAGPVSAKQPSRYSVAGGCWSLDPASGGAAAAEASRLRLKATDLGRYMLFRPDQSFLAAEGDAIASAPQPSPAADWTVRGTGAGTFTLSPASAPDSVLVSSGAGLAVAPASQAGAAARFEFIRAHGCAEFPEAELNVEGRPAHGESAYGQVRGFMDGHMHWMNFEYLGGNFHCGRPWDRYGIPAALPDCSTIEGPQGAAAPVQNFLNYGSPEYPHDTTGWPKLTEWGPGNLTYEGTYYRWLERVWKSGLRLIVMPVNENRVLCQLMTNRRNPCDEMESARKELDDIYALQDYVDAQAGGPGEGFFRIVRNPFQARKVINRGQMAVVLEVEISEPFNCRGAVPASCSRAVVDRGLDELYARGVRSSLLLNKFDNALTGVRFDSGPVGALINAGNRESYGSFWSAETCKGPERDNTIETVVPAGSALISAAFAALGVPSGALPTYPPPPHCNTRGLTDLGRHAVRRMMGMKMIVNPDHMSQRAVDETLTLAEGRRYSGVISPHGWMDPRNWPRIWQLGGMAFPAAGSAQAFVEAWRAYRPKKTPFAFGWGYGADLGGLAHQGEPAPAGSPNAVTYPFKSLDGATTVRPQRTGERTFDYASEGVAHYGLYAEWTEEVRKTGGPRIARDLLRGPEAYLEMWERSVGVPRRRCQRNVHHFTAAGLGPLRLGLNAKRLLLRAGQPLRRTRAWTYCVNRKHDPHPYATTVMTPGARVGLVSTTAGGQRALGIEVGDPKGRVRKIGDRLGGGTWTARLGQATAVFVVRGGAVRELALAGSAASRTPRSLRGYLRRVPRKPPARRPSHVVGAAARSLSPARAVPLAAQRGASPFPYFCGIQPRG